MAISDGLASNWSAVVLEALQKNIVYKKFFNENFQGDAAGGQTVKIPSLSDVTIRSHSRNSAITWEALTDSTQDLTIDQDTYFAFMVDDIDQAQTKGSYIGAATRNALYGIQDEIDQYLVGLLASGATITTDLGTSETPLEINSANIASTLVLIARQLDDAKVPREGRAIALPPFAIEDLVNANISDVTNQDVISKNGFVGRYAGLDILMSQNVPNTASAEYEIIAGTNVGATMALSVDKVESMRLQDYVADGVRGIISYAGKVTNGGSYAICYMNEAAEPA